MDKSFASLPYKEFSKDIGTQFDLHRKFSEVEEEILKTEHPPSPFERKSASYSNWYTKLPHKKMRLSLISESNFSSDEEEEEYDDETSESDADSETSEASSESSLEEEINILKRKKNNPKLNEAVIKKHLQRKAKDYKEVFPKFKNLSLKNYQVKGVNWLLKNWFEHRNCILADEMGLGKTIQTLVFLSEICRIQKFILPFLIVVPLSTLENWSRETEKWTKMNSIKVHDIIYEKNYLTFQKSDDINICLTTYEYWSAVVYDEGHKLKSPDTEVHKVATLIKCDFKLILTGTPLTNSLLDLYTLLHFLNPQKIKNSEKFEQFSEYDDDDDLTEMNEFIDEISNSYILRRNKEAKEMDLKIPAKKEIIVEVDLTKQQKTLYRAVYERKRTFLVQKFKKSIGGAIFNSLKKICNHPYLLDTNVEESVTDELKTEDPNLSDEDALIQCSSKLVVVDKLLAKFRGQKEKVLIFSQSLDMLNILEDYLDYRNYEYVRLDGSTNIENRVESIDEFNTNPDCFMYILERAGIKLTLGALVLDKDVKQKNSADELKMLLQKGAYHFFLEDDKSANQKDKELLNTNIEELIEKARVLKYTSSQSEESPVETGKIESVYFNSEVNGEKVDWDDDKFWEKIIPEGLDDPDTLYDSLLDPEKYLKTTEQKDSFFQKLKTCCEGVKARTTSSSTATIDYQQSLWKVIFKVVNSGDSLFSAEQIKMAEKFLEIIEAKTARKKGKKISNSHRNSSFTQSIGSDDDDEAFEAPDEEEDEDEEYESTPLTKQAQTKSIPPPTLQKTMMSKFDSTIAPATGTISSPKMKSIQPKTLKLKPKIVLKKPPHYKTLVYPEKEFYRLYDNYQQSLNPKINQPSISNQTQSSFFKPVNNYSSFPQNQHGASMGFKWTNIHQPIGTIHKQKPFQHSDLSKLPNLNYFANQQMSTTQIGQQRVLDDPIRQLPSLIEMLDSNPNPYFPQEKKDEPKQSTTELTQQIEKLRTNDSEKDEVERKQLEFIETLKLKKAMKLNK
eukprot:gene5876-9704_t